ncbi:hypothetical protein AGMMS49545_22590 [Betaproteobacteria bacterium]|nr:hypothetical protein AGMMS49545_22590 [Betaproteobacteria bacterium]GHU47404.1 hypothetical protein AGMMS50289_22540 [Betaproteobacteria bacterium]
MPLTARLDLPPKDAIAFFERKGVHLAWDWHDTDAATHAQSFTVAKVTSLDMLGWFQNEIERTLKEGRTFEDFKKSLRPRLEEAGWWGKKEMLDANTGEITQVQLGSARRLRTIFQTNVQTSYMAGRYKRYLDNAENRPYWRYVAVMDSRTRAGHAALNGKIWRADDPIWQTLWPPNGWGCRCRVQALSAAEFEKSGAKLEDGRSAIVKKEVAINKNGDTMQVKGIRYIDDAGKEKVFWPDPSWDHNPALGQLDELQTLLKEKAKRLPEPLRQEFLAQASKGVVIPTGTGDLIAQQVDVPERPRLDRSARAYVVKQGAESMFEHLAVYDAVSGKNIARYTSGESVKVDFPANVSRMLDDPNAALVLHHNHPNSLSLSSKDLSHLTRPGGYRVVAHGRDGALFSAIKGAEISKLAQAVEAAQVELDRQIVLASQRRLLLGGFEAHIMNLALDRAGVIKYQGILDAARSKVYVTEKAAIDAAVDEVYWAIKRARL